MPVTRPNVFDAVGTPERRRVGPILLGSEQKTPEALGTMKREAGYGVRTCAGLSASRGTLLGTRVGGQCRQPAPTLRSFRPPSVPESGGGCDGANGPTKASIVTLCNSLSVDGNSSLPALPGPCPV